MASKKRTRGAAEPDKAAELVFALVAPLGTDLDRFEETLDSGLATYSYDMNKVRISSTIERLIPQRAAANEGHAARLNRLMDAGNAIRRHSQRPEALALAAAHEVMRGRNRRDPVRRRTAHVIRSLKHPEEALALRRIYGPGFFLIGVNAGIEQRRSYLTVTKGCDGGDVDRLLLRDEEEVGERYGQRTRDTFKLADVFLPLADDTKLRRFLRLVFGCPFETPSRDEYAMYLAFAASVRSADLSRQVGAVIVSPRGDVLSVGANDVPAPGGGLYWPGPTDMRDYVRGEDPNERQRDKIIDDAAHRLVSLKPKATTERTWIARVRKLLEDSRLADITEYSRVVHAEMDALVACARTGARTRGSTLVCTTFPCHVCAKHIVAAGLKRVLYVEPYPKSQALELFPDSISLQRQQGKVSFEQFEGIGPRRYLDLFSMRLGSGYKVDRKEHGLTYHWDAKKAYPRVPMLATTYLAQEQLASAEVARLLSGGST